MIRLEHRTSIIDYSIYPALLLGTALILSTLRSAGFDFLVAAIISLVALRFATFFLELVYPRNSIAIFRDKTVIADLGYYIIRIASGRYLATFGVIYLYSKSGSPIFDIWPHGFSFFYEIALFFVFYEVGNYFVHRCEHSIPFLWWIHSIHHSPRTMHHFRKDRDHFLHVLSLHLTVIFPLMAVGAPTELFVWFTLWEGLNSTIKHSNVRHKLPYWLHLLVPSADLHHLHHSVDPQHGNSNYANFPLIDIAFGTFTHPATPIPGYGIREDNVPQGFWASLIYPFVRVYNALSGRNSGSDDGDDADVYTSASASRS